MKFGKLPDISNIDFQLPKDAEQTKSILSVNKQDKRLDHTTQFFVGATGWSMKEWVGKIYPKGAKSKDFLLHYGKQFNTIELNTTHYRIPTTETIKKWKAGVPKDFRFCPKIPQSISHSRDLGLNSGQIALFCEVIQGLGKQLGCCFMQLPPYFGFNRLDILKHFFEIFPSHIPLAVEIRHEEWFSNPQYFTSFFQILDDFRISSVITDVAGRRDVLHQRLTTPTAMIRFVGNDLHPTDFSRIDDWVNRLYDWSQAGLEKVYFFTHEPDNILAPELARYLVKKLKEKGFENVRGPKILAEENPQMSLF